MAFALLVGGTDQTSKILYGSVTLKLNTLDFALIDPVVRPSLLDVVAVSGFSGTISWVGSVASVQTTDPVDLTGHVIVTVTALNTLAPNSTVAPFDLSDNPSSIVTNLGLEDGTGHLLTEDGNGIALNSTSIGYRGLSVRQTINPSTMAAPGALELEDASGRFLTEDGNTIQTEGTSSADFLGSCTIYEPGLWPGMVFDLSSVNQGYSSQPFTVRLVTVRYIGLAQPVYQIDFGSTIFTLNGLYTKN